MEHRAIAPNGRAFLKASSYLLPRETPGEEYPFRYTTGRTIYHFHTRTKTARAPQLHNAAPEMWVEICPSDATKLGVEEGDTVRVESPRGRLEAKARISNIREGVVFDPFHYGYFDQERDDSSDGYARAANELTITQWDPVSKQPVFKVAAVKVTKVADNADGQGTRAPTTTASAPVDGIDGLVLQTAGGSEAEATEKIGG